MSDEDKKGLKDDPEFRRLLEVVGVLGQGLKELQASNKALQEKIEGMVQKPSEEKQQVAEDDLNVMSQAELASYILSQVHNSIKSVVSPIKEEVDLTKEEISKRDLKQELKEFSEKNPGIFDFSDELQALFQENPGLSISRAYAIVRNENPKKAKEVDEKYNPKDEKGEKPPFGGLTPTSGITLGADEEEKLTPEQAAQKAWDEVLSEFPILGTEDAVD